LISNALKFTPAGGAVTVSASTTERDEGDFFLKLSVADTGIGMSDEFMNRIFTPFEQERANTGQHFGGTGLGLSITHNLVHMLQGAIQVESTLGKGSVFTVTLPCHSADRPAVEPPDGKVVPDWRQQLADRPLTLLLAEDNEMNREIEVAILTEHGLTIHTAVDGLDARDMFLASPAGTYGAILMDLQMPRMDGYSAAVAIRGSQHPQAAIIPIIAVSADVFAEDMARALACGMNDYVSKPIDYEQLMQTLAKYIA